MSGRACSDSVICRVRFFTPLFFFFLSSIPIFVGWVPIQIGKINTPTRTHARGSGFPDSIGPSTSLCPSPFPLWIKCHSLIQSLVIFFVLFLGRFGSLLSFGGHFQSHPQNCSGEFSFPFNQTKMKNTMREIPSCETNPPPPKKKMHSSSSFFLPLSFCVTCVV